MHAPEFQSPLLQGLNEEQARAVTLPAEHALILAGAGSGKTRALTRRIAWLVETGLAAPHTILAVTFTNKAAKEMRARIEALLPQDALHLRRLWAGTFHGICNRLLRLHHEAAALPPQFQILDTQDQLAVARRVLKARNISEESLPARTLASFISRSKDCGQRAGDLDPRDQSAELIESFAAYDALCNKEGLCDFSELLLRCTELLRRNPALCTHYRRRFGHLLVDEFQDTSALQYEWLKLFARERDQSDGAALFCVGDDDQSIYAFRGARVGNMRDFEREFAVRHLIRLERNYRSVGHILNAANDLIRHNSSRLGKNLRTEAGAGERIRVQEHGSDTEEAAWLAAQLQRAQGAGDSLASVAVLYRNNAQSRSIESALFSSGVPYRVYGGLRFFERAEIKHALAYLRLAANPHDDGCFLRVCNFPTRGIGEKSLEQLQALAAIHGLSLWSAAQQAAGRAGEALRSFCQQVQSWSAAAQTEPLPALIARLQKESGLITHYQSEAGAQERLANLEELVNAALAFCAQAGFALTQAAASIAANHPTASDTEDAPTPASPLTAFLDHATLEAGENPRGTESSAAVSLMTIHAAKGLEFDSVFITGLEDGLFPSEMALVEEGGIEEERRLMYVAITRARAQLTLSHAQTRLLHGRLRPCLRSRFLDELPAESLNVQRAAIARPSARDWDAPPWARNHAAPRFAAPPAAAPLPARKANPANPFARFKPGARVFHNKFGEGTVTALEGTGEQAFAHIRFARHGLKQLSLAAAPLTLIE